MENASSSRREKSAPVMEVWNQGKPVEALMSLRINKDKPVGEECARWRCGIRGNLSSHQ